jgi:malonyl CoA-acyl carrier protein transacylase
MSNKNLSILFTGQGSQYAEMGLDLFNEFEWVRDRYQLSSDILGYDVLKAQNNPDLINLTQYSQPLIFILSSILADIYKKSLNYSPDQIVLAGHSLGEYVAMYFSEALNFEEMLKVVSFRGEAMSIVSDPEKYSMYAILKKEDDIINSEIFGDGVFIANLNSDKQIVICGLKQKLEEFKSQNNLGKYIPLNVSSPFHSKLMIESSNIFKSKVSDVLFNKVNHDLISNHNLVNYKMLSNNEYINQLSLQIHSPVMWNDTMKSLLKRNIEKFVEIGPKKTLLNFITKDFEGEKISINTLEDLKQYV